MFKIKNSIILAPLAGISDSFFRQICKDFGADISYSELISAEGIVHNSYKTHQLLEFSEKERPIGIQLFGENPQSLGYAVKNINNISPDFFDLNLGCSVKKVNKAGAGSILLKDLDKIKKIIHAMTNNTNLPISAKIRIGWDKNIGIEIATMLQEAGVSFIAIHGRTAKQQFTGNADWDTIKKIKENVEIPIIGNGDIKTPEDAVKKMIYSNVDGIMIGRGALGNPWIFRQIKEIQNVGKVLTIPSIEDKINILRKHYKMFYNSIENENQLISMRKFFHWYTKGIPNIKKYKNLINKTINYREIMKVLDNITKEA